MIAPTSNNDSAPHGTPADSTPADPTPADPTPADRGFVMPAEWAPHERTWMEFPPANETFGSDPHGALGVYRQAWAQVSNSIVEHEPVTVVANVGDTDAARAVLDPRIEIYSTQTNDAWFRDSGPTFLLNESGQLGATHWRFNAWGNGGFSRWDDEQHVGAEIAKSAGAQVFSSRMVNEGGGIHVDGEGTVLITETVQLDPSRNPDWTHGDVEQELRSFLGVQKVLWLPRGLTKDYERFGTRGHIDMVAAFARPGVVVAHSQRDREHPDFEVCRDNIARLRTMTDAKGRSLEVVEIPGPDITHVDGELVDYNYVNHYVCNGAVILCAFDDPRDSEAAALLAQLYPGRIVRLVDARPIFACGGGIHCITQQQPVSAR
jgi:agmatine deiminase